MQTDRGLKWNGEISAGTIIQVVTIAAGILIASVLMVGRVDTIQAKMVEQSTAFEQMRKDVGEIKVNLALKDGLEAKVQDHELRIRELERGR